MSEDASTAYKRLSKQSAYGKIDQWDYFYYCALIGMRKQKISNDKLEEFHKSYTTTYQPLKSIIAGLVVSSDLKRTGEKYTRDNISKKFKQLVSPDSELILNSEGLDLLNKFADGGFKYFSDRFPNVTDIFDFITKVHLILNEDEE